MTVVARERVFEESVSNVELFPDELNDVAGLFEGNLFFHADLLSLCFSIVSS